MYSFLCQIVVLHVSRDEVYMHIIYTCNNARARMLKPFILLQYSTTVQPETTWSSFMDISAALALTLCVCALQASAQQTLPSQLNAIVLNLCLPEENLATRAVDPVITNTLSSIASQLIGGACKSIL